MEKQIPRKIQLDILDVPNSEPRPPMGPPYDRNLFRQNLPNFSESTQFHRGPRGGARRPVMAWSALAALIDALILFSISCFVLLAFAMTMKVQMQTVLELYQSSFLSYGIFAEMLLGFFYLVTLRTFLGFTFGEWSCGLRLGDLKQRLQRLYGLKVIARTMLIFATGVITLPLLSLLFGRDIPGIWLGLSLIQHQP